MSSLSQLQLLSVTLSLEASERRRMIHKVLFVVVTLMFLGTTQIVRAAPGELSDSLEKGKEKLKDAFQKGFPDNFIGGSCSSLVDPCQPTFSKCGKHAHLVILIFIYVILGRYHDEPPSLPSETPLVVQMGA